MGHLNLEDVAKTSHNREDDHEIEKGYWEKTGDPNKFRRMVALDIRSRL
ncbi:hypothetical protein [Acetobacterium wieringae]|nr:hypothetical protein [Acetobacterium wieringae]